MEKDKLKTSCLKKDEWVNKVKTQLKKDIQSYYPDKTTKEIKEILNDCIFKNSISNLPKEIQDKYNISKVVKTGDRSKWVDSIKTQLKKDLKESGLEDIEIETLIVDCINDNSLDLINKNISKNYSLEDCYVYGTVNEENINELINNMSKDIYDIKNKGKKEENWFIECITKDKEYYCNVICGYRKHCKYYSEYIKQIREFGSMNSSKEEIDLLTELENL